MSLYKTYKIPEIVMKKITAHGYAKKIALKSNISYSIIAKSIRDGRAREEAFKAICTFYDYELQTYLNVFKS